MQIEDKEKKESVITICYGKERTWNNRNEAIIFFTECEISSEGSERERYANILNSLYQGYSICSDRHGN